MFALAPSPTGYPHIGNIRTVAFNWLFARQQHGAFVLRIEDVLTGNVSCTRFPRVIEDSLQCGSESTGMKDRARVATTARTFSLSVSISTSRRPRNFVAMGKAYRCNCSQERLDTIREAMRAEGKTPMYDGLCRDKTCRRRFQG